MKNIVSIKQFSKEQIETVLEEASVLKKEPKKTALQGVVMASCFFEPSTRTRLSFESAMMRLGGSVIGFAGKEALSIQKGESFEDTMRMMEAYADVIVVRHPEAGAAARAAEVTHVPVINAGDGSNEHPTQTLLDLFTIQELHGSLEGLKVILAGDLKYGRTAHSLALALAHFGCHLYCVAPPSLQLPDSICSAASSLSFHEHLEEVVGEADVLYMTRLQKERMKDDVSSSLVVTPELLERGKKSLKVLHPLPRVNEISTAVDSMPQAAYFTQAKNGLYIRQALLMKVLTQ